MFPPLRDCPRSRFKHGGGCGLRVALSGQVEANGFGFYYAVFDSLQWMVVEQRPLQRPERPLRRAERQRGCRGCRSLAPCATAGTRQAATILACSELEDAW